MNFEKSIHIIDTHTVGQATRIIVGGIPVLRGKTMMEKKEYFIKHCDDIRVMAMHEPRGHADMFGAVLTEPIDDKADYGMIFIDGVGCLNMCGHGTIGVATALVETNMVEVKEPYTDIVLESPAGLISVRVEVEEGRAKSVSFQNVPAFLYKKDVKVQVPELGTITCDISFGGNFFAIVKNTELQVEIEPENLKDIVPKALNLLKCINEQIEIRHPLLSIHTVDLVEIFGEAKSPKADMQNVVVLGEGEVDRSPCGTGTCAKVATLYARNELALGEKFVYESVLRTKFSAKALKECQVGEYRAVIPEITGSAYITGFNHLVLDKQDPIGYGFTL